jgi:hypothetical protein
VLTGAWLDNRCARVHVLIAVLLWHLKPEINLLLVAKQLAEIGSSKGRLIGNYFFNRSHISLKETSLAKSQQDTLLAEVQ